MQYALAASKRDEAVAVFLFDEHQSTLRTRCRSLGMELEPFIKSGHLFIREFIPATVTPGEVAYRLHNLIEEHNVTMFVLDSLNGYLNAMPGQSHLLIQLHELLGVLSQSSITTLMIAAQHGVLGSDLSSPIDASYLTDALMLFRFFEAEGEVRRAVSVVKKRSGMHEQSIRELRLHHGGIEVGPATEDFQGVLTGQPIFHGTRKPLL
jgi:circadian clock protein KaiC